VAFPEQRIAVEINGGIWSEGGGRHTRPNGYSQDCHKLAEALCLGWRVLQVTGEQVKSGQALGWLERMLGVPA
jgi:hypothetical protein